MILPIIPIKRLHGVRFVFAKPFRKEHPLAFDHHAHFKAVRRRCAKLKRAVAGRDAHGAHHVAARRFFEKPQQLFNAIGRLYSVRFR